MPARDSLECTAWPESYIATNEVIETGSTVNVSFLDNISNFIIVLLMLTLFSVAFMRIAEGLITSAISIGNYKRLLSIEQQNHLQNSRNTTLFFLLLITAFIFANFNALHPVLENPFFTGANFLLAFGTSLLYLAFRASIAATLDWINKCSIFTLLNRFYNTFLIVAICLSIIGFIIFIIFETITFKHIAFYIAGCLIMSNLLYYMRCYKTIISNGFSHFFLFLYLCTLEILPQVVLAHLILS